MFITTSYHLLYFSPSSCFQADIYIHPSIHSYMHTAHTNIFPHFNNIFYQSNYTPTNLPTYSLSHFRPYIVRAVLFYKITKRFCNQCCCFRTFFPFAMLSLSPAPSFLFSRRFTGWWWSWNAFTTNERANIAMWPFKCIVSGIFSIFIRAKYLYTQTPKYANTQANTTHTHPHSSVAVQHLCHRTQTHAHKYTNMHTKQRRFRSMKMFVRRPNAKL